MGVEGLLLQLEYLGTYRGLNFVFIYYFKPLYVYFKFSQTPTKHPLILGFNFEGTVPFTPVRYPEIFTLFVPQKQMLLLNKCLLKKVYKGLEGSILRRSLP